MFFQKWRPVIFYFSFHLFAASFFITNQTHLSSVLPKNALSRPQNRTRAVIVLMLCINQSCGVGRNLVCMFSGRKSPLHSKGLLNNIKIHPKWKQQTYLLCNSLVLCSPLRKAHPAFNRFNRVMFW